MNERRSSSIVSTSAGGCVCVVVGVGRQITINLQLDVIGAVRCHRFRVSYYIVSCSGVDCLLNNFQKKKIKKPNKTKQLFLLISLSKMLTCLMLPGLCECVRN